MMYCYNQHSPRLSAPETRAFLVCITRPHGAVVSPPRRPDRNQIHPLRRL